MDKNRSAEDKLLRLIKGAKSIPAKNAESKEAIKLPFANIFAGKGKAYGFTFNIFRIEYLTHLAIAAFIVSLGVMGTLTARFLFYSNRTAASEDLDAPGVFFGDTSVNIKPFSFYRAVLEKKTIFNQPAKEVVGKETNPVVNIAEVIANYNLSGIISGDTPKAVIEDKKYQKSYFLKEGESAGDLTVEGIGNGKVSLNYKGEKFELVL